MIPGSDITLTFFNKFNRVQKLKVFPFKFQAQMNQKGLNKRPK